ncbi:hypothetical protein PHET_01942, partial [Paragonimus heterotremus]
GNKHALTKTTPDRSSEKENKFISGTSSASSLAHSSRFSSRRRNHANDKSFDQPSIPLVNGFSHRKAGKPLSKDDPQPSAHASNCDAPVPNGLIEDHENHTKIMRPMMDKEHLPRKNSRKRHFSSVSADAPTSCAKHLKTGPIWNSASAQTDALCQIDGVSQDVDHQQASMHTDDNITKCYSGRRSLLDWDSFISLSKKHRRLSLQPNDVSCAVGKLSPSSQGNAASTRNNHSLNQPPQRLEPDSHFIRHYTQDVKTQKNHFANINTYTTKHPKAIAGSTIHFDRASAKGLKVTYSAELLGHRVVPVPTHSLPSVFHAVTNKPGANLRSSHQSAKSRVRFSKRHTLVDSANSSDTPIRGVIEPITLKTDKDHCVQSDLQGGFVPNVVQQSPVKPKTDASLSEMTISLGQQNPTGRHSVVSKATSVLTAVNAVDPQDLPDVSPRNFLRRSVRKSRLSGLSLVSSSGSVATAQSPVTNSDTQPMDDYMGGQTQSTADDYTNEVVISRNSLRPRKSSTSPSVTMCPYCSRTMLYPMGLKRHLRLCRAQSDDCFNNIHEDAITPVRQGVKTTQEVHSITQSTLTSPTHTQFHDCPYCTRRCTNSGYLKLHIRACKLAPVTTPSEDGNREHYDSLGEALSKVESKTDHPLSDFANGVSNTIESQPQKIVTCADGPYCARRFATKSNLKRRLQHCLQAKATSPLTMSSASIVSQHFETPNVDASDQRKTIEPISGQPLVQRCRDANLTDVVEKVCTFYLTVCIECLTNLGVFLPPSVVTVTVTTPVTDRHWFHILKRYAT